MFFFGHRPACLLSIFACLLPLAAPATAQGTKLSGPLARPIGGDIRAHEVSPDGTRVVYVADQDQDEVFELYVAKSSGAGVPVKLAGPSIAGGQVYPAISIGPRGRRVVFTGDLETDGVSELFSVPLSGGHVVKLNLPLAPRYSVGPYEIDPAEKRVVYLARSSGSTTLDVYSVPIEGGASVKLNSPIVGAVGRFQISPDGARVVYLAPEVYGRRDLFSVPISGGPVVKLNPPGIRGVHEDAWSKFVLDPRGTRAAFVVQQEVGLKEQLYSAALDGRGPALALLPAAVPGVTRLLASPAGGRVVCTLTEGGNQQLVSVPFDGSAAPAELHSIPGSTHRLGSIEITSDGLHVLFEAGPFLGAFGLFRAPIDGSSPPVELAQTWGSTAGIRLSPDGSRVVYLGLDGLYSANVEGSGAPVRIADGGSFALTPDGQRVVFLTGTAQPYVQELFGVPIGGGAEPVKLNATLPFGGNVSSAAADLRFGRGGRVLYVADQNANEQFELFSAPADGSKPPVRVSGSMLPGRVEGDVGNLALSPDGRFAVYVADAQTNDQLELFSVRTDGLGQPVRLHEPVATAEGASAFRISPDGSSVVYWFARGIENQSELRVVPIEGGTPVHLAGPVDGVVVLFPGGYGDPQSLDFGGGILFDPAGTRVFFSLPGAPGLFRVPLDGSAAAELVPGTEGGGGITFTPDGSRLVFLADRNGDYQNELYSVASDGSAPALRLDDPIIAQGRVQRYTLTSDGTRVVFLADRFVQYQFEVFVVPVDDSAEPLRLSPPLGVQRIVRSLTAAGSFAYFLSDVATDDKFELYRVPLDASAPPVRLNAPLVNRGNVTVFRVTPEGARVVYLADQELDEHFELYSAPSDGSGPVVELSGDLDSDEDVVVENLYYSTRDNFEISPDGTRIAFRVGYDETELYSAPLDGSSPAVELGRPLLPGGAVLAPFRFTPDGTGIVYRVFLGRASLSEPNTLAILRASSTRPGEVQLVSGIGTAQPAFAMTPDGRVVFHIDQDSDSVVELFVNLALARPPRGVLRR